MQTLKHNYFVLCCWVSFILFFSYALRQTDPVAKLHTLSQSYQSNTQEMDCCPQPSDHEHEVLGSILAHSSAGRLLHVGLQIHCTKEACLLVTHVCGGRAGRFQWTSG